MDVDVVFTLLVDEIYLTYEKNSNDVFEEMGLKVGRILSEKKGADLLSFNNQVDVIKYFCKNVWSSLFGREISSLKTNSQNQYILIEHDLPNMKSGEYSMKFISFIAGIIEGFLKNAGLKIMSVECGLMEFPSCYFHVKIFADGNSNEVREFKLST